MSETNLTENKQTDGSSASSNSELIQQIREVELRSHEVQEIMGYIPHWIIRWGISVLFMVIILVLAGSYFFKYPDIIASTVVLTTENPPVSLMARTSGKIEALFVQDNQKVNKEDHIAILENATNYKDLFELHAELEKLKDFLNSMDSPLPQLEFRQDYSLGELQSTYASFIKSYDDYRYFISLGYHQKKIASINEQIERHKNLTQRLERQNEIMEEELTLGKQQYDRAIELHKTGVISQTELEQAHSSYLQKQYSLESSRSSLSNSKIQISQLEQSVLDLDLSYRAERTRIHQALQQSYENLSGHISQWEQNYLLKSPISGIVTFNQFWSINQNVKAGDIVVTIIPEAGGKIVGKVKTPVLGSGKVKIGQKVNIKFVNYPHMDFGIVVGIVKSKSLVATTDNFYSLEVELPYGMRTSYGKTLKFDQQMQGTAEIITEDIRLIDRILKPLKTMLKNDVEAEEGEEVLPPAGRSK